MNARTLTRLTFANPASAVYLALVGGSIAVAAAVTLFSSDPGFVWVWPALFTLPVSTLVVMAGDAIWAAEGAPAWFLIGGLVLCALVQSLGLGALWQTVRGHRRGLPHLRGH
ncbi:SCO4225 family membrane protein [Streptomyces sp. ODS05-4]|uniref:SCO4225 family membrane protein n=1 Tax=Streptomyces sp. ODS05-4 TaxID=2944939 RepID=UPI00210AFB4C|nr:hypothetical protein [Streptomyces sp. ODS05-4]